MQIKDQTAHSVTSDLDLHFLQKQVNLVPGLRPMIMTRQPFKDSVDQNQTAPNVMCHLGSTLSDKVQNSIILGISFWLESFIYCI